MENPFDYNEVEAQRNFEKNVIFGDSHGVEYVKKKDFMKSSLAAANMLHDEDEEDISNITMMSSMSIGYSKQDRGDSIDQGRGQSARTHVPKMQGSFRNSSGVNLDQKYSGLDDYVMNKPQVSAEEYQTLSNELARARKMIETLKSERWTNIPVKDTVKRMLTEKDYSLEGYKSLKEKQELLSSVCKAHDGNAIIVVVLFLEKTLNKTLFYRELRKQTNALTHYAQHLKGTEDWKKLESTYNPNSEVYTKLLFNHAEQGVIKKLEMYLIEDAAATRYEMICKETDLLEKLKGLQTWVLDYGLKTEVGDMAQYVRDEISLMEQQRQIEAEDQKRLTSNPTATMTYHPPTASVLDQPLITTVSYCALYHYDKSSKYFPEVFKKKYNLNDKQYEWAVIRPRAKLRRWDDIAEILTSTSWLKKKSEVSAIGFEHICTILYKAKANEETLTKYLSLISNIEIRIKYASRFNAHSIAIDAIVQSRDRQKMEQYRLIVGQNSQYRQKINDLLNSTGIKWR